MPAAMKRPAARSQPDEQPVLKRPAAATVPADYKDADRMAPLPESKEELENADWNTSTAYSVDFCWLCDAQQAEGDLNFRNLACDAPWRSTLVDPQHAFIEDGHLIWTAAGIGRYAFVGDWLHTVHLGIMCHLLASVMDCIADTYAGNKEVRNQHLWNDLVTCHKEMGASTGERNRFPSFPFLKLAQPIPC